MLTKTIFNNKLANPQIKITNIGLGLYFINTIKLITNNTTLYRIKLNYINNLPNSKFNLNYL